MQARLLKLNKSAQKGGKQTRGSQLKEASQSLERLAEAGLAYNNRPALAGSETQRIVLKSKVYRRQTGCRVCTMRPLLIGLVVVAISLSLLVLAQQTFLQDEQEIAQVLTGIANKHETANQVDQSATIYNRLMRPMIEHSNQTSQESDKKFQKNERGQLNYRAVSLSSRFPNLTSNSVQSNITVPQLTGNGQNSSQVVQAADSNGAITADKIRLNSKREETTKMQQQTLNRNNKCINNKYDRLIAQKISLNDLSRPIVTSDGSYNNPFSTWNKPSFYDVFKFLVFEFNESNVPKDKQELDKQLPILKPDFEVQESQRNEFRVTWIGHSTLLIQIDGYSILTDPIFSERASPVQFTGPKRIREPACDIESLPPIDIVLVSHNHYDHLDSNSVAEINKRFGNNCRWIVPLGLGEYLQSMSVENYVELDWWQKDCFHAGSSPIQSKSTLNNNAQTNQNDRNTPIENGVSTSRAVKTNRMELDVYLTPSQHWSRRGINDVNKSLWGSFTIVSSNGSTFFFGGDTAYCSAFKEIGKIFGPITGAALPIGAYKPRWFLKTQHVDPVEATQIHRDLRSMKSMSIHHSTFILSNEDYTEPPKLLRETMEDLKKNSEVKEPFVTLKHGETAVFCKSC